MTLHFVTAGVHMSGNAGYHADNRRHERRQRRFLTALSSTARFVNPSVDHWSLLKGTKEPGMQLTLGAIVVILAGLSVLFVLRRKNQRDQREMEQHSITPEQLHELLALNQEALLFDVRQPLDLLAYPEIIPRAQRIAPNEVIEKPSLIPREKDVVVYCTCPSDKTSRMILRRALKLHFYRVKLLKGGLAGWKARGYPVEPYKEVFHLYSPSLAPRSG
jgi:rhodanese-related sulfurtransferase